MRVHLLLIAALLSTCSGSTNGVPRAPSELEVSELSGGAHVIWKDNSSDEDEFQLERKVGSGAFESRVTVLFDTIQYHDAMVSPGVAYVYRVRASNTKGASEYSNEATFMLAGGAGGGSGGSGGGGGSGGSGGSGGGSSAIAPSVTIIAPDAGLSVPYDTMLTFRAAATQADGGALSGASLVWRTNLSSTPLGTGAALTTVLPIPGNHTVTCTATDPGGNMGVGSVSVTTFSPVAGINHPGDGETRSIASGAIPFIGVARDFEDGPLPDAGMVWTSNLDGMIGTGRSFNRTLSQGTNIITLTVTDSDGNMGTKSITLNITP
jgi:hypothetical protein